MDKLLEEGAQQVKVAFIAILKRGVLEQDTVTPLGSKFFTFKVDTISEEAWLKATRDSQTLSPLQNLQINYQMQLILILLNSYEGKITRKVIS